MANVEKLTHGQRSIVDDMRQRGENTHAAQEVLATLEGWLSACETGVRQLERLLT